MNSSPKTYTPLEGLRVIELASVLAGPAVGMFFAELGAEVIKVENRSRGGDMTRQWKLGTEKPEASVSAYFSAVNYHKSYLDLNLGEAEDRLKLDALLQDADVVINNMKPSAIKRFKLDAETLRSQYPALILAELRGFSEDQGQVAFDVVLQAETGYIAMCGSEAEMAKLPVAFIDLFAAHQLKEAILLALLQRAKDGKGAYIRSSLEESALASLANQASNHLMTGHIPSRMGTLHPNIAPYGELVSSADGAQFVLAIGTDAQFVRLCDFLGLDLAKSEHFATNHTRLAHRTELHELLSAAIKLIAGEDFYQRCIAQQIPVGRIRDLSAVLADRAAQAMVIREDIEGQQTSRLSSIAFSIER